MQGAPMPHCALVVQLEGTPGRVVGKNCIPTPRPAEPGSWKKAFNAAVTDAHLLGPSPCAPVGWAREREGRSSGKGSGGTRSPWTVVPVQPAPPAPLVAWPPTLPVPTEPPTPISPPVSPAPEPPAPL